MPQGLELDIPAGLDHAQKAIEYGQGDPDALSTGGYALGYLDFDPLAGLTHVNESLGINPNSARAHDFAGWLLCYAGQAEQALTHFDESINLSRIDTFTFRALAGKAFALFFLGQVDDAVEFARRSLMANPNFTPCHRVLAAALAFSNRDKEARQVVDELLQRVPGLTVKKFSRETRFIFPAYQNMLLDGLAKAGLPGE